MTALRRRILKIANTVAFYICCLLVLLYFATPHIWLITSAFSPESKPYIQLVRPTFANLVAIFKEHNFVHYAINSAIISVIGTLITVSLSVIGGYALHKLEVPDIVILALWVTTFVPLLAYIIPYYIYLSALGLVNTYIGAAIVLSVQNLPYYMWLMKNFLATFPKELEEAAMIDGCGRIRILFSIVLPLSLPPVGLIAAMAFNGAWGDFLAPLVLLSDRRVMPLSVGMFTETIRPWAVYEPWQYNLLAAFAILYIIPPILLFTFTHKYLRGLAMLGAGVRG